MWLLQSGNIPKMRSKVIWIRNLFEIHIKATKCEVFTIDILRHRQVEPKILLVLIPMVVRNRVFRNIQDTYQLKYQIYRWTGMAVRDDTIRSALIWFRSRFRPDSPEKWKILRFFRFLKLDHPWKIIWWSNGNFIPSSNTCSAHPPLSTFQSMTHQTHPRLTISPTNL